MSQAAIAEKLQFTPNGHSETESSEVSVLFPSLETDQESGLFTSHALVDQLEKVWDIFNIYQSPGFLPADFGYFYITKIKASMLRVAVLPEKKYPATRINHLALAYYDLEFDKFSKLQAVTEFCPDNNGGTADLEMDVPVSERHFTRDTLLTGTNGPVGLNIFAVFHAMSPDDSQAK